VRAPTGRAVKLIVLKGWRHAAQVFCEAAAVVSVFAAVAAVRKLPADAQVLLGSQEQGPNRVVLTKRALVKVRRKSHVGDFFAQPAECGFRVCKVRSTLTPAPLGTLTERSTLRRYRTQIQSVIPVSLSH